MTDTKVTEIKGVITLADGSTSEFSIGEDFGWQQWGAVPERLGQTVDVVEAMVSGLGAGDGNFTFASASDEDEDLDLDADSEDADPDLEEEADDGARYSIIRFFQSPKHDSVVIKRGLTKAEALEHTNNPETSSSTATGARAAKITKEFGEWFDGFHKEG